MEEQPYIVSRWVEQQPLTRSFWAEVGRYPSLQQAHMAARMASAPDQLIAVTQNGRTMATYTGGEVVVFEDE